MQAADEANEADRLSLAHDLAMDVRGTSGRRRSAPVRSVFVRDIGGERRAPLTRLVGGGGRGHEVALKLYLSLIWRSAAAPYATKVPARRWAELLALPSPDTQGARRISAALRTLADLKLVTYKLRAGEAPEVTLLHESGSGDPYIPPRGGGGDRYFHVSDELWVEGGLHQLTAPGVAMLLAVLVDQSTPGAPVWWATSIFEGRFGMSAATRSRGTKQLIDAGLLMVSRKPVSTSPSSAFSADRMRNEYRVIGAALYTTLPDQGQKAGAEGGREPQVKKAALAPLLPAAAAVPVRRRPQRRGTGNRSADVAPARGSE